MRLRTPTIRSPLCSLWQMIGRFGNTGQHQNRSGNQRTSCRKLPEGEPSEKTEGALVNRYAYNAYGQRTSRQTRNGSFRQEERRSYDRFGRLVKIESGNHVVLYRYNDRNQLESQILNGMRIRYEYTKYGQLKKKILVSQ